MSVTVTCNAKCDYHGCTSIGRTTFSVDEAVRLALSDGWTKKGKTSGHGGMDYHEELLCPLHSPAKPKIARKRR
jgi:hypothetical protein